MQIERRAVIDIGTNSVKLLVAEVEGASIRPILEQSRQTRLGQGFYKAHRLQAGPIAQTAKAAAEFAELAKQHQATRTMVIATSAARDATNSGDLAKAVEEASGLPVRIISGEQEAAWGFQGVTTDATISGPVMLLEVGGGSTQFSVGSEGELHFQHSFRMGTVRLIENMPHSDPPTAAELAQARQSLREFLDKEVSPSLKLALKGERARASSFQLVGTGGTASILGGIDAKLESFDRERIESVRLTPEQLRSMTQRLWGVGLEERKKIVGLPANRADVILAGVCIYETAMETFGFKQLRISTRGLRFGAILSLS